MFKSTELVLNEPTVLVVLIPKQELDGGNKRYESKMVEIGLVSIFHHALIGSTYLM